ncbi:hypothetical protein [Fulvivirga sediminis]|uniref:Uncharacterized protein n=1 Tax=Fulvivirga sediminis TaxID=2803949 RepID=A0A937FDI3_9BACT|nr:hypothetical protein [Fulvivirga sediminis]MBL3658920.1 hypothetical protein [Fulvivirga sediminis]
MKRISVESYQMAERVEDGILSALLKAKETLNVTQKTGLSKIIMALLGLLKVIVIG